MNSLYIHSDETSFIILTIQKHIQEQMKLLQHNKILQDRKRTMMHQ